MCEFCTLHIVVLKRFYRALESGWVLDILWSVIVALCLSKVVFFQNKGYLMQAFKKFAYHTIFQGKVKRKEEKERP